MGLLFSPWVTPSCQGQASKLAQHRTTEKTVPCLPFWGRIKDFEDWFTNNRWCLHLSPFISDHPRCCVHQQAAVSSCGSGPLPAPGCGGFGMLWLPGSGPAGSEIEWGLRSGRRNSPGHCRAEASLANLLKPKLGYFSWKARRTHDRQSVCLDFIL